MGIHCGPVFANLYLAFYEKRYLQDFDGLYRRYIDDIFVLHPSDDVVSHLIQAPGMKIAWHTPTLDYPSSMYGFTYTKGNRKCASGLMRRSEITISISLGPPAIPYR